MTAPKPHKRVEYTLEIFKPSELQGPGADASRRYCADSPFHSIHIGDTINAFAWTYVNQKAEDLQREMGGRDIGGPTPIAVVESVQHQIHETEDKIRHSLWVFTKLYEPAN